MHQTYRPVPSIAGLAAAAAAPLLWAKEAKSMEEPFQVDNTSLADAANDWLGASRPVPAAKPERPLSDSKAAVATDD
jgi:hypothetical protein